MKINIYNSFIALSALVLISSCTQKDTLKDNEFIVEGEFTNLSEGENIYLYDFKWNAENMKEYWYDTIAKATIKNGKFIFKGTLDAPRRIELSNIIKDDRAPGGIRFYSKMQPWIVPGEHTVYSPAKYDYYSSFEAKKGDFAKEFYAYKSTQEYKKLFDKYENAQLNVVKGDLDSKNNAKVVTEELATFVGKKETEFYHKHIDVPYFYTNTLIEKIVDSNTSFVDLAKIGSQVDSLEALMPKGYKGYAKKLNDYIKLVKKRRNVSIGSSYKEVMGELRNGKQQKLSQTLKENKYVLLDFWASWCGPCREEFPYMRKVYPKYNKKGFEIFCFSVDAKKEAWIKASDQEKIPWLDVRMKPEATYMEDWAVTGIPANFLIESATEKIIATNLKHNGLGDKLKELFGK